VQRGVARHDGDVMQRFAWFLVLASVLAAACAARADERGWTYVMDKLVADGIPRERVLGAFRDWRVPAFTGIEFSAVTPREPRARYRRFLRPATVAAARRCRAQYAGAFAAAERTHGVSADVLAAILFVETGCGRNTGSSLVFYRLARLAMANEPANVQRNVARYTDGTGYIHPDTIAQIRRRAQHLEDTFYPEVQALFEVADRMGVHPLDVRGSTSGAFGYPQFLPTSYLRFATDGNGDGRVSLYDTDDAVASCAHYFAGHGWRPGLTIKERRAVVWQYNRSDAYVDTVLALAARVAAGSAPKASHATATRKRPQRRPGRSAETAHRSKPRS
jgi:membrane-bound lytic murein transglycosylase B